jgi:indolepyruvate ferredoxin oxidoreductase, alpha subunit
MVTNKVVAVDAISHGLLDGGVAATFNFPGFFSHDIFEQLGGKTISLNERVAYAEGFGASLAGKRSVVTFKNVGLNVASDAFLHSIISGVRAGLVLILTDDVSVWGSQESQDSRSYMDFFGGLWLEPTSLQEAYDFSRDAFELSEKFDIPVVIRLTNPYFDLDGTFTRGVTKKLGVAYENVKSNKFVVHPVFYKDQQKNLNNKNQIIQKFYNKTQDLDVKKHNKGVIAVGAIDDINLPITNADVFAVNTYPLPVDALRNFIDQHDEIEVIEHGGPYVAKKLHEIIGTKKITSILPNSLGEKWPFVRWTRYQSFFDALKSISPDMVVGDVTQFTVEKNDTVKACLALGVAVSTSIGYASAEPDDYVFSLSGDCSILHEGIGIIDEAVTRNIKLGIVIFDNGGSWCTGGQERSGGIDKVSKLASVKSFVLDYEATTEAQFKNALNQMREFNGVSVLNIKVPMGSFERD